ncbi:MAG: ADP-ribosylglycohydrolase family protein [Planctomycetota bacterium]|nr:ADP-ribosylglycohydrolase family protein [Planctomycetota bacterium]
MSPALKESKTVGALLGTFAGDALGMPVEGYDIDMIVSAYDRVDSMLDARKGRGTYTDDTQMMIGIAEALSKCGEFQGAQTARCFVDNFEKDRGYGRGALEVLYRLSQGVPWNKAGERMFGGGSFGNGSAMRIAPIGVFFSADRAALIQAAIDSARITHTHPLGTGGAVIQALAVSLAFESDPDSPLDKTAFLTTLKEHIEPDWYAYHHKLVHVQELLDGEFDPYEVVRLLGNDVTCQGSVPLAIYCFLMHPDDFRDAVVAAVNMGGDTDTIGAMAGALSGARLGWEAIPPDWLDALENGDTGRDYVAQLGRDLHAKANH